MEAAASEGILGYGKRRRVEIDANDANATPATTEFLDLNDDCLILIASQLSLPGLNSFASTCTRLQDVARSTFVLRPENKQLDIIRRAEIPKHQHHQYIGKSVADSKMICDTNFSQFNAYMTQYLVNFGALIEILHFKSVLEDFHGQRFVNYSLFEQVIRFCDPDVLKSICLEYFHWTPELVALAKPLFQRVEKLEFRSCSNIANILQESLEVNELKLVFCFKDKFNDEMDAMTMTLPKLTKLTVFGTSASLPLEQFIDRHRQIEQIKLQGFGIKLSSLRYLSKLTDTELRFSDDSVDDESNDGYNYEQLKCLEIFINNRVIEMFLRKLADSDARMTLESLVLRVYRRDDNKYTQIISRFGNLQKIQFHGSVGSLPNDLVELNVTSLTKFQPESFKNITKLKVQEVVFNDHFIRGLVGMSNLRELFMGSMSDGTVHQWDILSKVNKLIDLEIENDQQPSISNVLLHLGSTDTLKSFTYAGSFDSEFISDMCRFTELRKWKFRMFGSARISFQPLQRLTKLEEFNIEFAEDDRFVPKMLMHLGAGKNLKRVTLPSCKGIDLLRRSSGVQYLDLGGTYRLTDDMLVDLTRSLSHLRELSLIDWPSAESYTWNGFLSLIRGAAELEKIELGKTGRWLVTLKLPRHVFEEMAEICFRKDKVLTIRSRLPNEFGIDGAKHGEFLRFEK